MENNSLSWKIGGEAGYGIMTSGLIFAKVCSRAGLHVFDHTEYPSLIRGGHNTYQVHACMTCGRNLDLSFRLETQAFQNMKALSIPDRFVFSLACCCLLI